MSQYPTGPEAPALKISFFRISKVQISVSIGKLFFRASGGASELWAFGVGSLGCCPQLCLIGFGIDKHMVKRDGVMGSLAATAKVEKQASSNS